jgi:hypothetical protein
LGRARSSGGFARRANFNDRESARSCCEPSRDLTPWSAGGPGRLGVARRGALDAAEPRTCRPPLDRIYQDAATAPLWRWGTRMVTDRPDSESSIRAGRGVAVTRKAAWAARAFLSVEETSVLLGVSRSTLYRSLERGDFPVAVVQLNGRLRVSRRAIERLLDGRDPALEPEPTGPVSSASTSRVCPTCGASPVAPRRVPMCSAARRSSSSTESV